MTSSPRLISVNSSNIKAVAYKREENALYIQFRHNSALYRYPSFPYKDYLKLRHSESIGKEFNSLVRPLKDFERLS